MLTNLAPASLAAISRGDNFTNALGSFASLLWLFNIDRLVTGTTSSATAGGRIVLYDVTVVLPAYELQSLRLLLLNATSSSDEASVHTAASRLLMAQLRYNQVTSLLCNCWIHNSYMCLWLVSANQP